MVGFHIIIGHQIQYVIPKSSHNEKRHHSLCVNSFMLFLFRNKPIMYKCAPGIRNNILGELYSCSNLAKEAYCHGCCNAVHSTIQLPYRQLYITLMVISPTSLHTYSILLSFRYRHMA